MVCCEISVLWCGACFGEGLRLVCGALVYSRTISTSTTSCLVIKSVQIENHSLPVRTKEASCSDLI
jgi:hypothetical protein